MEPALEVNQAWAVPEADPTEGDSDAALARRIAAGDTASWQTFFTRFFPWTYRFAYHHLLRDRAEAEDLCLDILLVAVRSIHRFDARRGTLDMWLVGIARHRLSRFRRKQRATVPHDEEAQTDPTADLLTRAAVNQTLASLPERQASLLIGKYVLGHSTEELARLSHSTPKAIESSLSRARAAFRAAFLQGGTDD
jgi:RNA polymerase sigma factor (sigma-70 family)